MTKRKLDLTKLLGFRLAASFKMAADSKARTPALKLMGGAAMVGGKTCLRFVNGRTDG